MDGHNITGAWIDEAAHWEDIGWIEHPAPLWTDHGSGVAIDVDACRLSLTRPYDPDADAPLLGPPVMPQQWAVTMQGVELVVSRHPRWPRPVPGRRLTESRVEHAGRRRVATTMRRRARRRGIPAVVVTPRDRVWHARHVTISAR